MRTLALSIVVLTGWSGQVSLGQMGFAAIGATVGAKATRDWGLDLILAFAVTAGLGAVVAVGIGLPALRLRGSYLAVTTLAAIFLLNTYLIMLQRSNRGRIVAIAQRHPGLARLTPRTRAIFTPDNWVAFLKEAKAAAFGLLLTPIFVYEPLLALAAWIALLGSRAVCGAALQDGECSA